MTSLSLIPLAELLTEVLNRYEDACFIGTQSIVNDDSRVYHAYVGSKVRCIGLCHILANEIEAQLTFMDRE